MSKVDLIIGGYERGGTTLLSEIFRANGFESGFECGVLLADQPAKMPETGPYWEMLLAGWRIEPETRAEAAAGDFDHFYNTLCTAAFPDHTGRFFDKTPRYMAQLGLCLHRYSAIKSAVIIHRDPRAVFLSMAMRMLPNIPPAKAVTKKFKALTERYLDYFIGCIAHQDAANVLFVPLEELVSREDVWMKTLGYFVTGKPFQKRDGRSRFDNVGKKGMDLERIMGFESHLPASLQAEILDATRLASPFFADATERARYGDTWAEAQHRILALLAKYERPRSLVLEDGTYFEPFTYLLRYADVRRAGRDPVEHYQKSGKREGRLPH